MSSIEDVARQAGVSITTVSRVLTGSAHPVRQATRERVLEAARQLNYSPSALAQALVRRDTRIVGVIVGDASDPYFAAIVRGVEDVARRAGYLVIVCNSDRIPSIELRYLNTLNDYRVDGVIFAGGGLVDPGYVEEMRRALAVFTARGAVCVSLGKHLFESRAVVVDNERVVQAAVEHLVRLGHKDIAYLSGPRLLTTAQQRLSGYQAALERHGLASRPELVIDGDYKYDSGLRAAEAIHAMPRKPTAVVASNDLMGIGCIVGLKNLGYRIPDDISIAGVDDIPQAEIVDPPMTTVALPLYDLGAAGMETLIQARSGKASAAQVVTLPHRLVVRRSTAPPGLPAAQPP
jgi:LacI family transcriptional regulator